jgi:dethiobiotin synthase
VARGLFITGTDTNVGKTVVAAALLLRYGRQVPLRYWKPIQTGIEQDDDTAEVVRLSGCPRTSAFDAGVRLPRPVSPHLAARLAGKPINIRPLIGLIPTDPDSVRWVVEGAGGVLVPVNDEHMIADLAMQLGFPVLVVARSTLGTINHTLLTLEAVRRRALDVAGVVMVGPPDADNRAAIAHYGRVVVLGEMPRLEPLTGASLAAWAQTNFDPSGRLLDALR